MRIPAAIVNVGDMHFEMTVDHFLKDSTRGDSAGEPLTHPPSLYTTRDIAAKCMHSGCSENDEDLRGRPLVRHVLRHLPVVGGAAELARGFGHVAPQRWKLVIRAEWDCGDQGLLLMPRFRQERPRRRIESRNRRLGAGSIPVSQAHDGDRGNIGGCASDCSKRRP
jgi:hypothetical protein